MCTLTEGIDYSDERIFETPHPYNKGDYAISESMKFPGASAICVEFDKRSQTDSWYSNDYIHLIS